MYESKITDVEKQSIIVCAWRLDTNVSAEKFVEALDKLVLLAKEESNKELNEKLDLLIKIHKPKEDKGKLDLPVIMKDKGCSTCRFNDACTDSAKEIYKYGVDCNDYEKWSNVADTSRKTTGR